MSYMRPLINRKKTAFTTPIPIHIFVSRSPPVLSFFIYVTPLYVFGMFQLQTSFEFVTSLTTYLLNNIHITTPINTVFRTVNPTNHNTVSINRSIVLGESSVHTLDRLLIMPTPDQVHTQTQSLFRIPHSPLPGHVKNTHLVFRRTFDCKAHIPSSSMSPH